MSYEDDIALGTKQDRITSLESHNRELLAVNQVLREALQNVRDRFFPASQHPAARDMDWDMVNNAANLNVGDVTIIEVAEVAPSNNGSGLISAKYNSSPECRKLMYGTKLYTIQTKSYTE